MQEQQIKAQEMEKERERDFIAEQNQLDRDAKLREAALKVVGFDTDTADNDRLDAIEQSKLMIEQSRISNDRLQKENDEVRNDNVVLMQKIKDLYEAEKEENYLKRLQIFEELGFHVDYKIVHKK